MPSIGSFSFTGWAGKIPQAVAQFETFRRPGLDGIGIGFDAYTVDPVTITTRAVVSSSDLDSTVAGYQALVQKNVDVKDGMEVRYKGMLVVQVRGIVWDQLINPAGSYLVTAEWVLLRDVSA
jgi:hypothetical protein